LPPPCSYYFLFSGSFAQTQLSPLYFDRTDVKNAIHAPVNTSWTECTDNNVFPDGDASLPPAFTVLPNVIEKSNRSVIVHGLADFILIADGYVFFCLTFVSRLLGQSNLRI
jgi:carboxypeptidase D